MASERDGGNPAGPPHSREPAGESILVVDDEPMVRQYIARILRETGYMVVEAEDAPQAISVLEQPGHTIKLIVCDLVMPGMSGLDLAQHVARRWTGTRMLFVSGYPREALVNHGIYHPKITLLAKPFLPSRLLEAVEELRSGAVPDIGVQLTL